MRLRLLIFSGLLTAALISCSENAGTENAEEKANEPATHVSDPAGVPREDRIKRIEELEVQVVSEGDQPTESTARKLMGEYIDFTNFQHNDELVPEYLFRAGTWANYIGRKKKAVELFTNLYTNYKSFDKRPEAMNMVAFIYDFELNEKQKAKEAYAVLIKAYPDHSFANDARMRLETIDLTDEELIKQFEQQNKPS